MKIGFDNDKYLKMQSEHIRERINQFGNKLYLEFGGKLFDDYHASRVLPGFEPDSKLRMLMQLSDQAEIVIVISAADIDKNKVRGDLGITYDEDVLRLMEVFTERGLYVGSVCITQYSGQESADAFRKRLEKLGIKVYVLYLIPGYPNNTSLIVSDEFYKDLPKDQQKIIEEAAETAKEYARKASDERIEDRMKVIKDSGTKIVALDKKTQEDVRKAASDIYKSIKENVSKDIFNAYLNQK